MQSKIFSGNKTLLVRGKILDLNTPKVMGILNITPDSFYDGGRYEVESELAKQIERMINDGADIIDIGGYSSRPGAEDISSHEEWSRVKKALQVAKKEFPSAIISIDTFRSEIAQQAVQEGADIINDISGGQLDKNMFKTIASLKVPYIMMHMRGTPQTMGKLTNYENLIRELIDYFHALIDQLTQLGVNDVIIDPGFGFAKNVEQNFELLKNLELLHMLGKPLLVGLSRKSMIWKTLNTTPEHALNGTSVLNTYALLGGASILRVHDVRPAKEAIQLLNRLQ